MDKRAAIISRFNKLHGRNVRRSTLLKLKNEAASYKNDTCGTKEIHDRLERLLSSDKGGLFAIELTKKVKFQAHKEFSIEELKGMGIPFLEKPIEQANTGMNKSVSSEDIYKMITEKVVSLVKKASGKGYVKKWRDYEKIEKDGFLIPFNFITKKTYSGINFLMLKGADLYSVYDNPYFLTRKQVETKKGKIKNGSKSKPVIYFTILYSLKDKDLNLDFSSYDKKAMVSYAKSKNITEKQYKNLLNRIPIIKHYEVYNGADIEGIDFELDKVRIGKVVKSKGNKKNKIAELIVTHRPKPQVKITHGGNKAYYSLEHSIQMPKFNQFESANDYYRTLFHELTHSTGHSSILNRDLTGGFGSKKYAKEELVAEFGAIFLSAQAGIIWHTNKNHEEYLKGWHNVLGIVKEDSRFLMRAASMAKKSTNYLLNLNADGNPKFYKDLEVKTQAKKKKKQKKAKPEKPKAVGMKGDETVLYIDVNEPTILPVPKITQNVTKIDPPKTKNIPEPIPEIKPIPVQKPLPAIPKRKVKSLNGLRPMNKQVEKAPLFDIPGPTGEFLQAIEKKPVESVAVVLSTPQGTGKTTALYKWMNDISKNYSTLFLSLEEHPDSNLATDKRDQYLSPEAQQNISTTGEIPNKQTLEQWIDAHDVIAIDSWQKLVKKIGKIDFDEDLRKKFNGKLFIIIFQQTVDGKAKGGSDKVFDGDVIVFGVKGKSFDKNYLYFDKHRYTRVSLDQIYYNISDHRIFNSLESNNEEPKEVVLEV